MPGPDAPPEGLAVVVRDLSKAYGDYQALCGVSFAMKKGECLGIVGFNGAGKSTLLQIIAGTLQPTSGSVQTSGRIVALLELGAGFNDDFTGVENVFMNASILGISREAIRSRLPQIEAFAEIGDFIHKPVKTYSSGMRVRLAFSILTQVDPDIMIIDEALAVGDAYFTHKCARLIRTFRENGRSLLFVSHDPGAVKSLCDRAILLEKGCIVRDGPPATVLDYYNAVVATRERDHEILEQELNHGRQITRSGNKKAILERFELLDDQDRPVRALPTGAPIRICCVVSFAAPLADPTVGFLIRDRLGSDVFGTNTFHLKVPSQRFEVGDRAEFCFETVANIGPGNYSLTLAVHGGANHIEENYDWFDQLIAFTVVPSGAFGFIGVAALPVKFESHRGVRRLHRRCEMDQAVRFSEDGTCRNHMISGWSVPEVGFCWTLGEAAVLAFELPFSDRDAALHIEATPYLTAEIGAQVVDVEVAGQIVGSMTFAAPETRSCRVPSALLSGEFEVRLILRTPVSPAELGHSADHRRIAIAVRKLWWSAAG